MREVHFLSRIAHEHIIGGFGCGTTAANLPCILLAWCETDVTRALRLRNVGRDAAARAATRAAWPSGERLRIMRELAAAIEFLHNGSAIPGTIVLHRDLKPDNLGLTENRTLKLLDFGLAVALARDTNRASAVYALTGGAGSRRYMAPEIAREDPRAAGAAGETATRAGRRERCRSDLENEPEREGASKTR